MRNPEIILNTLCSHSSDADYKYERLYRLFFNEELFMVAYERIKSKPGNMTPGSDGKTIDGMSLERINALISSLRGSIFLRKTENSDLSAYLQSKINWCKRWQG